MMNDLKPQGEWKIQLTVAINFFSSINSEETRTVHTKSNNTEIIIFLQKYQKGLEKSMKGSEFIKAQRIIYRFSLVVKK